MLRDNENNDVLQSLFPIFGSAALPCDQPGTVSAAQGALYTAVRKLPS